VARFHLKFASSSHLAGTRSQHPDTLNSNLHPWPPAGDSERHNISSRSRSRLKNRAATTWCSWTAAQQLRQCAPRRPSSAWASFAVLTSVLPGASVYQTTSRSRSGPKLEHLRPSRSRRRLKSRVSLCAIFQQPTLSSRLLRRAHGIHAQVELPVCCLSTSSS
jgi:hypothetical protein